MEIELKSRECPFFPVTSSATSSVKQVFNSSEHEIKTILYSSLNIKFWFLYFEDLNNDLHPEDDNEELFDAKKNRCKNKRILSLVKTFVAFFNQLDVTDKAIEDFADDGKFSNFSFVSCMKLLYNDDNRVIPMLMALVYSIHFHRVPYYGDTKPYRQDIEKSLISEECLVEIAPIILKTEIKYESLVLKSWEEEEEIEMAPKKKRKKKETEIATMAATDAAPPNPPPPTDDPPPPPNPPPPPPPNPPPAATVPPPPTDDPPPPPNPPPPTDDPPPPPNPPPPTDDPPPPTDDPPPPPNPPPPTDDPPPPPNPTPAAPDAPLPNPPPPNPTPAAPPPNPTPAATVADLSLFESESAITIQRIEEMNLNIDEELVRHVHLISDIIIFSDFILNVLQRSLFRSNILIYDSNEISNERIDEVLQFTMGKNVLVIDLFDFSHLHGKDYDTIFYEERRVSNFVKCKSGYNAEYTNWIKYIFIEVNNLHDILILKNSYSLEDASNSWNRRKDLNCSVMHPKSGYMKLFNGIMTYVTAMMVLDDSDDGDVESDYNEIVDNNNDNDDFDDSDGENENLDDNNSAVEDVI
jgi:hypothetical protein